MKSQQYNIRGTNINKIQFSEIEDYLAEKGIDTNNAFDILVGDNPKNVYMSVMDLLDV